MNMRFLDIACQELDDTINFYNCENRKKPGGSYCADFLELITNRWKEALAWSGYSPANQW